MLNQDVIDPHGWAVDGASVIVLPVVAAKRVSQTGAAQRNYNKTHLGLNQTFVATLSQGRLCGRSGHWPTGR